MKSLMTTVCGIGMAMFTLCAADGDLVNNGATTDGLVLLSSQNAGFDTLVQLRTLKDGANDVLEAAVAQEGIQFFPLRNAWVSSDRIVTGGVYRVAADFRPLDALSTRRGGVIGWLDAGAGARRGIALNVRPAAEGVQPAGFVLSVVDFNAMEEADSQTVAGLYQLDGPPARFEFDSALSELGNYDPTSFATFELVFAAATAADRQAVSNATARVTGRVLQGGGATPAVVSRVIELLTDLPVPAAASHRFGYFAYRAALFGTGVIGQLDNLRASGEVVTPPNAPPVLKVTAPQDGAVFIVPAAIEFTATASDPDGLVRRVEYFANQQKIGEASEPPYRVVWSGGQARLYSITARATDDRGASTVTTDLLDIVLRENFAPVVSFLSPTNGAVYLAPDSLLLAAEAADGDGTVAKVEFLVDDQLLSVDEAPPYEALWLTPPFGTHTLTARATDNRGATGTTTVSVRIEAQPVEPPTLAIRVEGASVTLSWPANFVGFTLESKDTVGAGAWTAVPGVANNSVTVPVAGFSRFFRLRGS